SDLDIPLPRPSLYVCVRVDQTRDHRLADQADLSGAPRHVDLVHAGDGLDVAALDQDEGVLHRLAAGAVDQRGACERDDTVSRRPAGRNQEDKGGEQAAGRTEALHRGSLDVWSCRISQRSPRFCRSNVNGPPATTESLRCSTKRAVQRARSSVSGRTRTSSKLSESRVLPGAK